MFILHNLSISDTPILLVSLPPQVIRKKLGSTPSRMVKFFSFSQDRDSVLNTEDGRKKLRDVGIGTPSEVGDWLVGVFREDFQQENLADQLDSFIHT